MKQVLGALWLLYLLYLAGADYTPKDNYLIDCGGQGVTSIGGRNFSGDVEGKHVSGGSPLAGSVQNSGLSAIYSTARVFKQNGQYSFDVTPGRHWIRFHFMPFAATGEDLNQSTFSVGAGPYLLLSNINVAAELQARAKTQMGPAFPAFLLKEYSINITSGGLTITFSPSPGSFAFINAIEVVSMPDVYVDDGSLVGQTVPTTLGMSNLGLQTMYRLNVGGVNVDADADSSLGRSWISDERFLVGARKGVVAAEQTGISYAPGVPDYTAPQQVYGTARVMTNDDILNSQFNLTWSVPVDGGYVYYVRLHFCEIVLTAPTSRVFDIFINGQVAMRGMDVIAVANGAPQTAIFKDFVVRMDDGGSTLTLELGPQLGAGQGLHNNSILNGLEIFKTNNTKGSLAGLAIPAGVVPGESSLSSSSKVGAGAVAGGVVGGLAVLGLLVAGFCYFKRRRPAKGKKASKKKSSASWTPLHAAGNSTSIASKYSAASHKSGASGVSTATSLGGGRPFTFAEIMEATNSFDESRLLGVGGFGKVYRGEMQDGTKVAVKRGNPRSEQGLTEFQTEIEMLSKLRHRHLVSLIGYCEEHCEMILVYECMANGTLRSHLYGSDLKPLSWKQRLEICVGAARGLHYLHTGAAQGIIHRDVKTTNILLDENLVAKVSDFGLSKTGPSLDRTHVSTAVKGSFGYLDPEYFRRQQLTEKSDVYSFGVVLFEVLCARPAINPALPREQVNIAEWAMQYQRMGMLEQIVDPHLKGQIKPASLQKFGETAEKCLAEQGIDRPSMGDVLWNLEYAQQLQESVDVDGDSVITVNGQGTGGAATLIEMPNYQDHHHQRGLGSDDDFEDASASAVFSQLVNPQGR